MSTERSTPPRVAMWLLRHACPGRDEALTGDLVEQFGEGRSAAWFWKQTSAAIGVGLLGRWPEFLYATAVTVHPVLLPAAALRAARGNVPWWELPWPWSQIVFEGTTSVPYFVIPLAVLGLGLWRNGGFRWGSLARTGLISILVSHVALFPWMLNPGPGNPYARTSILPGAVQLALLFAAALGAAWWGCRGGASESLPRRGVRVRGR